MPAIGDEPYQMKQKFPDVYVAVDKNRRRGIERLCDEQIAPGTEVILLDDAFQHRYVKPGINILLVDYHRLICDDKLLPAGRLREPKEGKDRANIVIVTKCPEDIKPMGFRVISKALKLYPVLLNPEIQPSHTVVRRGRISFGRVAAPQACLAAYRHRFAGTNENGPRTL